MNRLQELCPAPESFRARIYGGADTKAALISSIDDHSVKKERLASSVLSSDADDTDRLLYSLEKLSCLIAHNIRSYIKFESDEMITRWEMTYFFTGHIRSYELVVRFQ